MIIYLNILYQDVELFDFYKKIFELIYYTKIK